MAKNKMKNLPEKAEKKIRLPEKYEMNLYMKADGAAKSPGKLKLLAIILIVLFLAFAVVGRYVNLFVQKAQLEDAQSQLAVTEQQLIDYDQVKDEYSRYSMDYQKPEERDLEKRMQFISVAEQAVKSKGVIRSIQISNNSASVECSVNSLNDVAKIRKALENNGSVNSVTVYTANKGNASDGKVLATLFYRIGKNLDEQEAQ